MAPLDPQQLLKALNELLGSNGAIMGPTEAVRVANLMKDASKLVSKCVYINILKVDTPSETLEKLLSVGGWDTINDWLQACKDDENYPMLVEILKVYHVLPITVEILKTNNAAKTIKQLCKSDNESVKTLATNIFAEWMKKVKGNNNNEENSKKKKKDKREKESEKKDSSSSSDHNKSKSRDSKHSSHSHHHDTSHSEREKSDNRKTQKRREIEEENMDSSSNDSAQSEEKVTIRKGPGLKLHFKLGSDKDKDRTESKTEEKKRPSTVKRPPSKFRSTGLEESLPPTKLPKNADLSKPIPKRIGCDIKSELPSKRSRPNMPPPLNVPPPVTTSTPAATSPQSPIEMHGKSRMSARMKANRVLHESSGFMDSLETSHRNYVVVKKKRRSSGSIGSAPTKGPGIPTTPPSPVSPTTATARSLPSVPSFYKDTQEAEDSADREAKTNVDQERSPSPTVLVDCKGNVDIKTDIKTEIDDNQDDEKENTRRERSESPADLNSSTKESKGLLTTGATKVKKKKKSVSWKEESELKETFYFELDDEERVNVNRPKDFSQAQRNEMMADRRAFESSIRMKNDHMSEHVMWYTPKVVDGYKVFEYGKESKERSIQKHREQSVLQALFFNKNMLPDNPHEPDMDHEEPEDAKTIPLEDMSGGEEFLYNYDSHPQAVKNKSNAGGSPVSISASSKSKTGAETMNANAETTFPPPQISQPPPLLPPGFNVPPGMQLPPDLVNVLNHLQNQPSNPNDPVMTQVQQILNNIMCGGGEQAFEQLQQIQQILNYPMGPPPPDGMMQGPPPGMPMIGMPPGGPPPIGPRTLLGSAPPGFMPQRPMGPGPGPGPGPNRFGPPGPPGNWGPQGNMGGPPQMGHQGPPRGNFRGRMRGPMRSFRGGQGGNFKVLCRHYAGGKCRMGARCTFLHPGVNGPFLSEEQMLEQQMMDHPGQLEPGSDYGPPSGPQSGNS